MLVTGEALQTQLRERALAAGATYFGVADLAPVMQYITTQSEDFLSEYPVGVSVGVALMDGVVDQLYHHLNGNVARTYCHHIYGVVARHLEALGASLAWHIEQSGYRALAVPAGQPFDRPRRKGLISHKLVAHLAGLGWIAKNCLLITKEHGPRVRWITILTDAPLTTTGGELEDADRCKSCSLCIDLCPVQAFTGIPFTLADPVEVRFNTEKCSQYLAQRNRTYGQDATYQPYGAGVCGLCVYVCPHGWSMKRKKSSPRTTPEFLRTQLAGLSASIASTLQS